AMATWQVGGLPATKFDIQASWLANVYRTAAGSYQIYDGATLLGTVTINQQNAPTGTSYGYIPFQSLGTFTVNSGTVRVVLTGSDGGQTVADAVRVASVTTGGGSGSPTATFTNA